MFAASCSGTTRAPFLIDMARDLSVSVPLIANLVAITSVAWGVASMLAGIGSNRWGRRPFLVFGPLLLAVGMLGVAQSGSIIGVTVWATLGGACAGLFTGVIYAEVAARVVDRQRGRALGWAMSGQSLTLVLGVPLAAWVGSYVGWRGVNVAVAVLGVMASGWLLLVSGDPPDAGWRGRGGGGMRAALTRPLLVLLAMGVGERICYGLTAVYFATFLQVTYHLSLAEVAVPLAIFALGNILGTLFGGQLADRLGNRRMTFGAGIAASGVVAVALYGWTPGLPTSLALGFLYVMCNALARPALMSTMAEAPDAVRGTVMGLNMTGASIGWLGAASLGGTMLAYGGFAGFGPLTAGFAMVTAVLAWVGSRGGGEA